MKFGKMRKSRMIRMIIVGIGEWKCDVVRSPRGGPR